jgi:hypothetical protein
MYESEHEMTSPRSHALQKAEEEEVAYFKLFARGKSVTANPDSGL